MINTVRKILTLSPFDESSDRINKNTLNSYRVFTVIFGLILAFIGTMLLIILPNDSAGFILYGLGVSLKAIEVLIEWHLGLKAMAKNNLILILFITGMIILIRNI